jgi:hypothetical protein
MRQAGMRVYAIIDGNAQKVRLLGFGVYEGDHPAPAGSPLAGIPNPRIRLDNGDVVWGFQCWWGAEEKFYKSFPFAQIEQATIEQFTTATVH